jgi:antitoxin component of MazEF toxin-antitoxin module
MSTIIKADAAGAVTLPADLCRAAGVAPGDDLVAEVQDGRIILQPAMPPFWERIAALTVDIPPEEFAKMPPGGAMPGR